MFHDKMSSKNQFQDTTSSKSRILSSSMSSSSALCPSAVGGTTLTVAGTTLTSATDLASFFECPVCFEYVLPPILQCPSGHLVSAHSNNLCH